MLTYLRREERRPSGWGRLTALFRPGSGFVEDNELPKDLAERRLNRRVYGYWDAKCRAAGFPRPADISAEELGEDWPYCFILDISGCFGFCKFDFLGQELAKFSGVFLSGRRDWTLTVLDKATGQVSKVVESGGPVFCDDELTLFDGRRLLFRSVLLPLSADQMTITHLLGAANGKLADAQN
jgi:hypothetical protein